MHGIDARCFGALPGHSSQSCASIGTAAEKKEKKSVLQMHKISKTRSSFQNSSSRRRKVLRKQSRTISKGTVPWPASGVEMQFLTEYFSSTRQKALESMLCNKFLQCPPLLLVFVTWKQMGILFKFYLVWNFPK